MRPVIRLLCSALIALSATVAQASETPASIRIGAPDMGASQKPFTSGGLGLAHIRHQLEDAFASDGIKVEWYFFKGAGPAVNEAFANNQIDVAGLGDLAAIIGRSAGLDTTLLLGGRGSNMYLATTPESAIKKLEDLKGKRVSIYRGTADQLSFARVLKAAGMTERDLSIVSLDWSAARAALAGRRIDAAWSGMGILALSKQGIEFPVSTKQYPVTATTQTAVVASKKFVERYPEVTQKLVDVLVSNSHWISDPKNLSEYLNIISKQSATPAEIFAKEYQGDNLGFRASPRLDTFLRSSYQDSIDKAKELGLVRRAFSVDDWFDDRFVEASIQKLGYQDTWPQYDADGKPE